MMALQAIATLLWPRHPATNGATEHSGHQTARRQGQSSWCRYPQNRPADTGRHASQCRFEWGNTADFARLLLVLYSTSCREEGEAAHVCSL